MIDAVEVFQQPFKCFVVWIHEIDSFTGRLSGRSYDTEEDLSYVDNAIVGSAVRYSEPEDGVCG